MNRILSIVKKDILQIFRNKFMAAITFLVVFIYALVYFFMPSKVDETFKMGFYIEKGKEVMEKQLSEEEGLEITWAKSENELRELVGKRDIEAGFSITFINQAPDVKFYVSSQSPEEIREAGEIIGKEIAYNILGSQLPIEIEEEVIGPDMLGDQIPIRDKMRIFFLLAVFLVEMYALANLITDEIRLKTVYALLVTPVDIKEFFSAKAVTGISMAFFEALLLSLLIKLLSPANLIPLVLFLFLCSILITAVAFLLGAISRGGMVLIIGWGMLAFMVLAIPAVTLIFPGISSFWIKVIPTFYFVSAVDGIINYGFPLSDYYAQAGYLVLYSSVLFLISLTILKRRLS